MNLRLPAMARDLSGQIQLEVLSLPDLKVFSAPGETESSFRARLSHDLHEKRDAAVEQIHLKYTSKITTLQVRIRRAEQAKQKEAEQRSSEMLSTGMEILGGVFGAMFGGGKTLSKTNIGKAASAAKKVGKVFKENQDVSRAGETIEALQAQLEELNQQIQSEADAIASSMDAANAPISIVFIKPKKTNIALGFSALLWAPAHPATSPGATPEKAW